ncbi:hypothetical protein [Nonomuraea sp. NPDC049504]|uniref:hypothetical protein n=1 Tax=Nonomuraea sp. NPDC049504 TaxID=3154729 RepID=UPI00342EB4C5
MPYGPEDLPGRRALLRPLPAPAAYRLHGRSWSGRGRITRVQAARSCWPAPLTRPAPCSP